MNPMESPRPRVQIGLPTYNRRDRLARAIDSVLAQTHIELELIISDNASTDGTRRCAARSPPAIRGVRYVASATNAARPRTSTSSSTSCAVST